MYTVRAVVRSNIVNRAHRLSLPFAAVLMSLTMVVPGAVFADDPKAPPAPDPQTQPNPQTQPAPADPAAEPAANERAEAVIAAARAGKK